MHQLPPVRSFRHRSTRSPRAIRAILEAVEPRQLLTTVSGQVFDDINRNEAHDNGEPGVAGSVVFADYNYNGTLDAGETNVSVPASGQYTLTGVANKPFALRVQPASGYQAVGPYYNNAPYYVDGTEAAPLAGRDFQLASPATSSVAVISGVVFDDYNHDGVQELNQASPSFNEGSLEGKTVYADLNNNSTLDAGEPSSVTAYHTSGFFGYRLVVPRGSSFTLRAVPTTPYAISLPGGGSGIAVDLAASPNSIDLHHDFGFYAAGDFVIGHVYKDKNQDSRFQSEEQAGAGHLVFVDLNANNQLDANETFVATTDANGFFYLPFDRSAVLNANDQFRVSVVPAPGYGSGAGVIFGVAGGSTAPVHYSFDLAVPAVVVAPSGQVNVTLFVDTNKNGRLDAGETGAAGQTVFADYNYNGRQDAGEPGITTTSTATTVTLPVDNKPFALRILPTSAYAQSYPTANNPNYIEYRNGSFVGGTSFGLTPTNVPPSTTAQVLIQPQVTGLGGVFTSNDADLAYFAFFQNDFTFWADLNRNGVRDAGEPVATKVDALGRPRLSITLPFGIYSIAYSTDDTVGARAAASIDYTFSAASDASVNGAATIYNVTASAGIAWGYVFKDLDKDGVYNANVDQLLTGQPGSAGWAQVWADYNDNGVVDPGEQLAQIGGDNYAPFDGVYVLKTTPSQRFTLASVAYAGAKGDTSKPLTSTSNRQAIQLAPYNSPLRLDRGFADTTVVTPPPPSTTTLVAHVYNDLNGNGSVDASESTPANGSAGQTVFADYNYNGVLDAGEASAVTDASGTATLNVLNKPFQLVVKPASGFTQSGPGAHGVYYYELRNGTPFGYGSTFGVVGGTSTPSTTTIIGHVFFDANGNDYYDAGETLRGGDVATVFIDANNNRVYDTGERTATIAADGTYTFSNVPVGTSGVIRGSAQGLISTFNQVEPLTPIYITYTNNTPTLARSAATVGPDIGFGETSGQIQGGLIVDVNGDGAVNDTDRGVRPADVWLDLNHNGRHDPGEPAPVVGTVNDPSLSSFSNYNYYLNVPPGAYTLAMRYPGDADDVADVTKNIGPTVSYNMPDYFLIQPTTSVITGAVYSDNNNNGMRDPGESGTFHALVYVDVNSNGRRDTGEPAVYSDDDGTYALEVGNRAATLRVDLTNLGQVVTRPDARPFDFTGGTSRLDAQDFGIGVSSPTNTQRIVGNVFNDLDGNGNHSLNEPGLAGQIVWADTNYNGVLDAGEVSATTDANGNYTLDLAIAPFALTMKPSSGRVQTSPSSVWYYEVRNGSLVGYGATFGTRAI